MSSFFEQFLVLPTVPPGSLAYHAILAFTLFGALQGALNNRIPAAGAPAKRMLRGLVAMLIFQVLTFIASGLAWQDLAYAKTFLPVLDRTVGILSLLIIIWLWAYPTRVRLVDDIATLLGIVLFSLAAYSLVWWQVQEGEAGLYFNGSGADVVGTGIALALLLLGIFILVIRRPDGWGYGLTMLLGLAAGYLAHWFAPLLENDFAGAVRLAEMALYPLLLALPQRFQAEPIPTASVVAQVTGIPAGQLSFKQDPKAQQALLKLSLSTSPRLFYQDLARSISQLMSADICLLALPQLSDQYLIFPGGYNLITDSQIDGFSLEERKVPALLSSLGSKKPLHLAMDATSRDLPALADALKVEKAGALLAAPVAPPDESPLLGLVLLTPYSKHPWTEADQQYLVDAAQALLPVIQRMQQGIQLSEQLEQSRQRMQALDGDATQAVSENEALISRLETLQSELAEERQRSASLAALVSAHTSLQEAPAPLDSPAPTPETLLKGSAAGEDAQLEDDLRLVLEEMANLRQSLVQADQKVLALQAQAAQADALDDPHQREVIVSIAQELRQPMSSIVGYTDLLLSESVGLLGAMQRKFIERVKASTERMGSLVEELIQLSALDGKEKSLNPVLVDLNAVIDEAVTGMIAQLSEKNIALRVDLPDELPPIQADLEALQQILSNLLSNASAATPADGEITLHARLEAKENEPSYLLLQVTDQGGGIPPQDLPRVFSRLYRADNVLIQGIGETGVGLSIVKALVEAHSGRIWVDTEPGQGSAFSILLPLNPDQAAVPGAAVK
mgnify:FL=1